MSVPCGHEPDGACPVSMLVVGQGMRGGVLASHLSDGRLIGEVETAPRYRMYAFPAGFPGLQRVETGGRGLPGELYTISYRNLNALIRLEPPQLEMAIIELSDGAHCLGMVARPEALHLPNVVDITDLGGWHAYRAASERPHGDSGIR